MVHRGIGSCFIRSPQTVTSTLFDDGERGPRDDLRLPFEAAKRLDPDEKRLVRELLDALLLKHQVRQWEAAKG